ncbi:hypothetical protein [Streptomyces sp. NPDC094049]|uniref:hypothetical protein n=1 Tax=Streptomyces sp. NPDC094049 TaxID=3154987 RepID=UPI00331FF983
MATLGPVRVQGTVMGAIGLEPLSGTAGPEDLADVCGWHPWAFGVPSALAVNSDWVAVFNREARALTAIVHFGPDDQVDLVLFQANETVRLTPTVWAALEGTGKALLCGVVRGGPTAEGMTAATAAGELYAVVADAHFSDRAAS